MSDTSKKIEAQQREMPEPYEGNRPVPWLVIIIVSAIFAWAIGYIAWTHQTTAPVFGDRRTEADFKVAAAGDGPIDGAQIYTAQCAACHQATGLGLPGVFPPLAESEWVLGKPEILAKIVLHGVSGDLTVNGTHYNGLMPTFQDKLNDAEIAAVLTHIRSSFGNSADKVDAELVKLERTASQGKSGPWNGDAELREMK